MLLEFVTMPNHHAIGTMESAISITYGLGTWEGCHAVRVFDDALFPVCAPKLVENFDSNAVKGVLDTSPLLQWTGYLDPEQHWKLWVDRLGMKNFEGRRVQIYSDYELLLQACKAGEGIAIGSQYLVEPFLSDGTLVRLSDEQIWTEYGYYLVFDPVLLAKRNVRVLIEFLQKAAHQKSKEFQIN